jgi:hypothetical protein
MVETAPCEDRDSEWVASRSILAYGVRIGIRTNVPKVLDSLSEHLPPLWKPGSTTYVDRWFSLRIGGGRVRGRGNSFHELFEDTQPGAKSRSLSVVLEDLERRMKMYVAEMSPRRVFVHAGAVGWKGKGIVIPGRSFSGKSSLVAAMLRLGATYYSDEFAVLDLHGRLHPYPQPLAIRRNGSGKQKKCWPEKMGGVAGTKALPIGLVVAGKYEAGRQWRPEQLSVGQAILELLDNTVPARRKPEVVISVLGNAVAGAALLKGTRGEADETATLILKGQDSYRE